MTALRSWVARQDKFLGAVRSPWELSLPLPVGFGTRRPPTYVGARDHRPTACSAPRTFSSEGLGRRRDHDRLRPESGAAARRADAAEGGRARIARAADRAAGR